jgi:hypothetical protein
MDEPANQINTKHVYVTMTRRATAIQGNWMNHRAARATAKLQLDLDQIVTSVVGNEFTKSCNCMRDAFTRVA